MKNYLKLFFSILITLIIFNIINLDFRTFYEKISREHIIILFTFFSLSYFFSSLRFKVILLLFNVKITFVKSLKLSIYQNFFNSLSISGSGEIIKFIKKDKIKVVPMAISIALEKIIGLASSVILLFFSIFYILVKNYNLENLHYFITSGTLLFGFVIYLFRYRNILINRVPYLNYILSLNLKFKYRFLIFAITIGITLQILSVFLYISLFSLNNVFNINITFLIIVIPLINFLSSLPLSISGIGIRDGSGILFFSLINLSPSISFLTTYVIGIFAIIFSILAFLSLFLFNILFNYFTMNTTATNNNRQYNPIKKIK